MDAPVSAATLDWSVASQPLPGETESGDRCVVKVFETGALAVVIDALGHGAEASHAADVASGILEKNAPGTPDTLFNLCHERMRNTRGAAISMASFDWSRRTMTWLGIGNVAGVLVSAHSGGNPRVKQLVVHGGVVGYQMPDLHPLQMPIAPGDVLVVATDGIRADFTELLPLPINAQLLAERILEDYATRRDDALVLVFPCNGDRR